MMNERLTRMINAGCNNAEIENAARNQAYAAAESVKIVADNAANMLHGIIGKIEDTTNLRDLEGYMKSLQYTLDMVAAYIDLVNKETTRAASDVLDAVQYLGQD